MSIKLIKLLLLCSLFFNIAHASVMTLSDECHNELVEEYMLEQNKNIDCGDLCDLHHLFHFMAILDRPLFRIDSHFYKEIVLYKMHYYIPPFLRHTFKPPII